MLAATMANAWRGRMQRAFRLDDFMPRWDRGMKKMDREIEQELMRAFRMHNEAEARRGGG